MPPSVSTGGRDNTVVRQVPWRAAVQTPVNYHCHSKNTRSGTSSHWSSSCQCRGYVNRPLHCKSGYMHYAACNTALLAGTYSYSASVIAIRDSKLTEQGPLHNYKHSSTQSHQSFLNFDGLMQEYGGTLFWLIASSNKGANSVIEQINNIPSVGR